MSERITVTQVTQIAPEVTPGVAVAANKLLQGLSIEPAIQANIQTFRPLGAKYTILSALGKEWVEAKISGEVACYNHLAYLLSGILSYAAPVQQGNTNAYLWTFTSEQNAADSIKTFTVEQGSSVRAGKFAYGIVTEFGLKFNREQIEPSGSMLGRTYQDGITMTSSPTAIAVQPILPADLDIYLDSTSSAIGTTKLTRVLSGEFHISDRFGPLWTINSEVESFAAHIERVPKVQLKLSVEADATGMGLLTVARAGEKRYIRLKAVGPVIASTYFYTLQMDMCGIVSDVGEFSDEDGVYAIEWTFDLAYDSSWGKAIEVQLINTLSDL